MLSITDLQFQYENRVELYSYSLEVMPQEVVAILGESGSGKSTLLDLIAGFLRPEEGGIVFNDKELSTINIEERPISILFQKHNLFEHLNVQNNILLGLKDKKNIKIAKIQNILKRMGLEKFEYTLVTQLSGGQQQRVGLARVLLREEPILLLDEPFSGLDEKTRLAMLDIVKEITIEYKLHTIMITHDITDCKKIANKTYKMENNNLIQLNNF